MARATMPAMDDALLEAARTVRSRAYAPYSGYTVGAALRSEDGRIFAGTNVENASLGLTVCAERNAVAAAVAAGARRFLALAVATRDGGTPCGACRQVLAEFAADLPVLVAGDTGSPRLLRLDELLPHGFRVRPQHPA
jgi:cytidine deaminase